MPKHKHLQQSNTSLVFPTASSSDSLRRQAVVKFNPGVWVGGLRACKNVRSGCPLQPRHDRDFGTGLIISSAKRWQPVLCFKIVGLIL